MRDVQEEVHNAKNALLCALRRAEEQKAPAAILKQLESLTGKAETLEWKLAARTQSKRK
jgi:hypothetical protein